jgi:hypothetical protein
MLIEIASIRYLSTNLSLAALGQDSNLELLFF